MNQVLPPFSALYGWPGPTLHAIETVANTHHQEDSGHWEGKREARSPHGLMGKPQRALLFYLTSDGEKVNWAQEMRENRKEKKNLYVPDGKRNICKALEGSH